MPFEKTRKCQHVMMSGKKCMSPAMRRRRFCVFHLRARQQNARILGKQAGEAQFQVPLLEDANSVQLTVMQVMQMLATRALDHKTAGTMLYALQTASINLSRPEFKGMDPEEEKGNAVLDALISIGKHLRDPITPEGQPYADELARASKESWEAKHPPQDEREN